MSKILKALDIQEKAEGLTDDLKLVKRWYEIVKANSSSSNIFHALVRTKWVKYGTLSYEHNLYYYASEELKALCSDNFKL